MGHTLLHSSPLPSQTTTATNSQSSSVANPAPSQVSRPGVQNRLLQLSGSQAPASNVATNAATASTAANCGTRETPNQVNVSLVESSVDFCFRPIFAMKVGLPNGQSVMAYGLFDTGSNKTLVSKEFQQQYRVKTSKQFVTLNGLGTTSSGQREIAKISLQSLVEPNAGASQVEAFVVESLPVNGSHIARQVHVKQYDYMKDVELIELPVNNVSILIGTDMAAAFVPFETRHSDASSPLALNTPALIHC